jgi:hypothetical protein
VGVVQRLGGRAGGLRLSTRDGPIDINRIKGLSAGVKVAFSTIFQAILLV